MITPIELQMLRASDNNAALPGMDTTTGNTIAANSLIGIPQLLAGGKGYTYNASDNTFYVNKAGAIINGVNFGNARVNITANNVTIENCTFSQTNNYYSIVQYASGATIDHCTFTNNGQINSIEDGFIQSHAPITITNNSFIDAAGDAIDVGGGIISGNYFTGCGYTSNGSHPDAIWVTNSSGPTTITNNFIDWTASGNAHAGGNDCIRITSELGNVSNVTVSGNELIGGATCIDAGNTGTGTFSNINITGNYIGFGMFFDVMPGPQNGVTYSNNGIVDFTNKDYSIAAWSNYVADGIATDTLLTATSATVNVVASGIGSTTLYGASIKGVHLYGGAGQNIFIGGANCQYLLGGAGKNIFSYIAMSDSNLSSNSDAISFQQGKDVIDLSSINANPVAAGDTSFTFIGNAAFSANGGEVRYYQSGSTTYIQADLAGDSSADLTIRLGGLYTLTAADFTLTSAQFTAAIAGSIPIAYFSTNQAALDQVSGGYKIIDTTANVAGALNALEADNANIGGITLTDSTAKARATITLTSAQVSQDAAILAKITSPYILAISSASSAVPAMLPAAQSNTANVASTANVAPGTVTTSAASAPAATITLTAAQVAQDGGVLANINSPFVLDTTSASGTSVTGYGNNLKIAVGSGDTVVTGGGNDETFVFASHFGTTRITDFAANANNAALRDIVSLSTTDFANWATLISDGHASGASNADTTFLAADGASLTIAGVSLHQFQNPTAQLRSDFAFHA
jgi:hypothetical protein